MGIWDPLKPDAFVRAKLDLKSTTCCHVARCGARDSTTSRPRTLPQIFRVLAAIAFRREGKRYSFRLCWKASQIPSSACMIGIHQSESVHEPPGIFWYPLPTYYYLTFTRNLNPLLIFCTYKASQRKIAKWRSCIYFQTRRHMKSRRPAHTLFIVVWA